MFTIYQCKTDKAIATANTLPKAIKLCRELLDPHSTFDNYVTDHRGRIVAFSDGAIAETSSNIPLWERGGSHFGGGCEQ